MPPITAVSAVADSTARNLVALVAHRESIPADAPLEEVQRLFAHSPRDFAAVLDGDLVVGVCARREIGMLLSARFGFPLNSRNPVRQHMTRSPVVLRQGTLLTEALQRTVARPAEEFFDDVVLVDAHDHLLGLIPMRTLVRVQDDLLREKKHGPRSLREAHRQRTHVPQPPPQHDLMVETRRRARVRRARHHRSRVRNRQPHVDKETKRAAISRLPNVLSTGQARNRGSPRRRQATAV